MGRIMGPWLGVWLAVTLLMGACAPTLQETRAEYVASHPDLDPATREAILQGEARVGMTSEQVRASCGAPHLTGASPRGDGKLCNYWGYKRYQVLFSDDGKVIDIR